MVDILAAAGGTFAEQLVEDSLCEQAEEVHRSVPTFCGTQPPRLALSSPHWSVADAAQARKLTVKQMHYIVVGPGTGMALGTYAMDSHNTPAGLWFVVQIDMAVCDTAGVEAASEAVAEQIEEAGTAVEVTGHTQEPEGRRPVGLGDRKFRTVVGRMPDPSPAGMDVGKCLIDG